MSSTTVAGVFIAFCVSLMAYLDTHAQPASSAALPAFEIASVRQNTSGEFVGSFGYEPGGRLVVVNNPVRTLIRSAYSVQNYQIIGGPAWMNTDRYDINARASGNPPEEQLRLMLRRLLSERFKLVARLETREVSIYALVVARPGRALGPNLKQAVGDCKAQSTQPQGARPACGTRSMPGLIMGAGVSMSDLARNLANAADRLVVDKSGLTGAWDFDLKYAPGPPPGAAATALPDDGASLFTAMQEQLGLRLESQRAPAEVLVITSIERPTGN